MHKIPKIVRQNHDKSAGQPTKTTKKSWSCRILIDFDCNSYSKLIANHQFRRQNIYSIPIDVTPWS